MMYLVFLFWLGFFFSRCLVGDAYRPWVSPLPVCCVLIVVHSAAGVLPRAAVRVFARLLSVQRRSVRGQLPSIGRQLPLDFQFGNEPSLLWAC